MPEFSIDETDRRILRHLILDSRQPVVALARRLGLSESAVRRRIEQLIKHNVIRRFTISVDYPRAGYPFMVYMGVKVVGIPGPEAAKMLFEVDEIIDIFTITGEFDLLLRVVCPGVQSFTKVVERIRAHDFVEGTLSFVVLKRIREDYFDEIIKIPNPLDSE